MARRERERLRLQAKAKKDQLEKVRLEQNVDAATGEVSGCFRDAARCLSTHAPAVHAWNKRQWV